MGSDQILTQIPSQHHLRIERLLTGKTSLLPRTKPNHLHLLKSLHQILQKRSNRFSQIQDTLLESRTPKMSDDLVPLCLPSYIVDEVSKLYQELIKLEQEWKQCREDGNEDTEVENQFTETWLRYTDLLLKYNRPAPPPSILTWVRSILGWK